MHQVSVGIQRELPWSSAVEARYVGTFGRDIWRGTDFNQVKISPDFLADFNRARSNGYLAQQAGLAFSPVFNPAVPGSVPLTVLPNFGTALLTNSTVISNLQTNQVAGLADFYMTSRVPGALATFMQNPAIYASQGLSNGGFSDYNSLQLELRRQYRSGFFGQLNYTLSNTQHRLGRHGAEPLRGVHGQLPAGAEHRPVGVPRDACHQRERDLRAAVRTRQEVAPFERAGRTRSSAAGRSARSSPGRAGRRSSSTQAAARSTAPGARTATRPDRLQHGVQHAVGGRDQGHAGRVQAAGRQDLLDRSEGRRPGDRPCGRRRQPRNAAGFTGQVFFNPAAGEVGNLPILAFDGPSQFRIDIALSKRVRLTDRYRIEVKGEAFNLTNTPSFFRGDMDINSTTFGRLTSVNVGSRVVQLSVRVDF